MVKTGLFILIGIFAGILTGLMGSSGVLIVIPSIVLLGFRIHQGVGISLAVDMIASIIVAGTYLRHGRVNLRQGLWIALAGIVGAQIGSRFSAIVPEIGLSGGYGIVLFANAVIFWRNGTRREMGAYRDSWISTKLNRYPFHSSVGVGLLIGTISGMFGVGGGLLFMIALVIFGHPLHLAVGTSTLIMALTTASGAIGHATIGNLPITPVVWISLGTILGSLGSATLANHLSERNLGRLVAVVFSILGIAMFASPFR